MIQDIYPHIYHNEYTPHEPTPEDIVLHYKDNTVFVKKEEQNISFLKFSEVVSVYPKAKETFIYLFSIDKVSYYLIPELPEALFSNYHFENNRLFRTARPKDLAFAGITGWQLFTWYSEHKFCGKCGSPMKSDTKERMLHCPNCNTIEYPKICPAVITAVRNGNKLLLSKYAGREYVHYALIAGFTEIGETIEETVKREVMEEVGLKVKNLHFYKSQPWSFSGTLLFGFFCDLDGEDTISLDEEELSMAVWMERENIPDDPEQISLTREMMTVFKNGEDKKHC